MGDVRERQSSGSRNKPLARQSSGDSNIFQDVLAQGPTSIPSENDMSKALAGIGIEGNGDAAIVEPPARPLPGTRESVGEGYAAGNGGEGVGTDLVEAQQEGFMRHGLLGWALSPLWMGIDALKWAGQTVNDQAVAKVVRYASPMGVANHLFDAVKNLTPQRARDLARIFGNATFNLVGLTQSKAGTKLRISSARSVDTFVSTVSAPAGRQLVIDAAATVVKVAAALDTPETKDAIQQLVVLTARFFDVLASTEAKAFLQCAADAASKACELAASPEATVMAAEFTANVVHALEMEHGQHTRAEEIAAAVIADVKADTMHEELYDSEGPAPESVNRDDVVSDYERIICDKFTTRVVPGLDVDIHAPVVASSKERNSHVSTVEGIEEVKGLSQADLDRDEGSLLGSKKPTNLSPGEKAACEPKGRNSVRLDVPTVPSSPKLESKENSDLTTVSNANGQEDKSHADGQEQEEGMRVAENEPESEELGELIDAVIDEPMKVKDTPSKGSKLPRFRREHFEEILTRRSKPLQEQMDAPDAHSIERVLSAARARVDAQEKELAKTDGGTHVNREGGAKNIVPEDPASLCKACSILIVVCVWTLLGLYGLCQMLPEAKEGVGMRDEL